MNIFSNHANNIRLGRVISAEVETIRYDGKGDSAHPSVLEEQGDVRRADDAAADADFDVAEGAGRRLSEAVDLLRHIFKSAMNDFRVRTCRLDKSESVTPCASIICPRRIAKRWRTR